MKLLMLMFPLFLSSAHAMEHTVTTSGQCSAEVATDRASIVFTVEKVEKDVKVAIQKATELHEKLRAKLKDTKVKDLELSTSEYSVYEKKEFQNNKQVNLGFAARIGLKAITSEVGEVSKLIAGAASLGISETGEFISFLSDEKELTEKKKCLETAALRAKEKAEALAKALGSKVGKVVAITEKGASSPQPIREMRFKTASASMADDSGPTIEGRKQSIQQDVDVTFAIEP